MGFVISMHDKPVKWEASDLYHAIALGVINAIIVGCVVAMLILVLSRA